MDHCDDLCILLLQARLGLHPRRIIRERKEWALKCRAKQFITKTVRIVTCLVDRCNQAAFAVRVCWKGPVGWMCVLYGDFCLKKGQKGQKPDFTMKSSKAASWSQAGMTCSKKQGCAAVVLSGTVAVMGVVNELRQGASRLSNAYICSAAVKSYKK